MEAQSLIWLLLPVAAATGWLAARRGKGRARACADTILGSEYIKGLNYLLTEQQDKAIDVFIRMLEVNSDTVETHLALGTLFRKRGEVDRAIRIHQNLIARTSLDPELRTDAIFELGQDYMRAGLYDRAEGLFRELSENGSHLSNVLPLLLDIYQQEKDWENAIQIADQMGFVGEQPARSVIAQFYCELAENARASGQPEKVRESLRKAAVYNPRCARVSLMQGDRYRQDGKYQAALEAYEKVVEQDLELLPEVLEPMRACHVELGTLPKMIAWLQYVIGRYDGISPVLVLAEILRDEQDDETAAGFIAGELARHPSVKGLSRFIDLSLARSEGTARENLQILKQITDKLLESKPVYSCNNCGFGGKSLYWQCPSCKHWNTVKPVHGVEGE